MDTRRKTINTIIMSEDFKILLRGITHGQTEVLQNLDGSYSSIQIKGTCIEEVGAESRSIISRLQFELYGEYPLDEKNQSDWDRNISKAFNFYI